MENMNIIIFSDLIKKICELDIGHYSSDNIEIINEPKECVLAKVLSTIKINNILYKITIINENDYYATIYYENKAISISNENKNKEIRKITIKNKDDKYIISKNLVYGSTSLNAFIKNNILIKDIYIDDSYCKIGYDLKKDKIYFYVRTDNEEKPEYIAIYYDKTSNSIDDINSFIYDAFECSNIESSIEDEINELLNYVRLYQENINLLNIDNTFNNQIYNFINGLLNNPLEAKTNSLKNFILNNDITNSKNLNYVKKQTKEIKKLNKKIKLTKRQ